MSSHGPGSSIQFDWPLGGPRFGNPATFQGWLTAQLARQHDESFAEGFAKACPVAGVSAQAYLHRLLRIDEESLLVGIRFKGGDLRHPFVDLLAWTGTPTDSWCAAIATEFEAFEPQALRYAWPVGMDSEAPLPGEMDQVFFAGPARGTSQSGITRVTSLECYEDFEASHAQWRSSNELGAEVWPASQEELRDATQRGRLVVAREHDRFLGLAACLPGSERSFSGWMMLEEFVVPEAQGHGLGARLQQSLMAELPQGELVWGTIHGKNQASQHTAVHCGRQAVETWWFVPLV